MISDRGANLELRPSHVDDALARLPDVRHVHLSGYTLLDAGSRAAGLRALEAAATRGLSTSVDAASAAPLRRVSAAAFLNWVDGVDLLLANLDDARTDLLAARFANADATIVTAFETAAAEGALTPAGLARLEAV